MEAQGGSVAGADGSVNVKSGAAENERGERPSVMLQCDEEYEQHVDFRWDPHVTSQVCVSSASVCELPSETDSSQVLHRITRSTVGWGRLRVRSSDADGSGGMPKESGDLDAAALRLSSACFGPFHLALKVELEAKAAGAREMPAKSDGSAQQLASELDLTSSRLKPNLLLSTIK